MTTTTTPPPPVHAGGGAWRAVRAEIRRRTSLKVSLAVVALFVLMTAAAPLISSLGGHGHQGEEGDDGEGDLEGGAAAQFRADQLPGPASLVRRRGGGGHGHGRGVLQFALFDGSLRPTVA